MYTLVLSILTAGQEPAKPPAPPPRFTSTAAVAFAAVDSEANAGPLTRYVWIREGDVKDALAVSHAVNTLGNRPPTPVRVVGGNGQPMMVRVQLDDHFRGEALVRAIKVWELLYPDPSFNVIWPRDALKLAVDAGAKPPGFVKFSLTNQIVWKRGQSEVWSSVLAIPHSGQEVLYDRLGTFAPVVECDYFVNRVLASKRSIDRNDAAGAVFDEVFRGLYYNFAGVRTAKEAGKKKGTDLDVLFEDLGIIDDADGSFRAQDKFDRLGSEQRLIMGRSNVTGKPRAVFFVPTLKTVRDRSILAITQDSNDEHVDLNHDPFANLLAYRGDAVEAIWVDNGGQRYALFNKAGALQFEVPPNIANDTTVPHPYTQRLDTFSCITCHGQFDGWQPLRNEVNLSYLLGDKTKSREARALIEDKFRGNADLLLLDLRRGQAAATLRMIGPNGWPGLDDQVKVYQEVSGHLAKIRNRYWYPADGGIDAAMIVKELGFDKPLADLLGPVGLFEDVRVRNLLDGVKLTRARSDLVKGFIYVRMKETVK